jgi:hypothetical protein
MNSNDTSKSNVIPASQRADGTWRKEKKIRPGYVNQEEVDKYVPAPKKKVNILETTS